MTEDPIIKYIRETKCSKCKVGGIYCDCWVVDLIKDDPPTCSHCQNSIHSLSPSYELPRYKPDIPRQLCETCNSYHKQTAELLNALILRENEEPLNPH